MTWGAYGAQHPSHGSIWQHHLSENDIHVIYITAGQKPSGAAQDKRPQQDSNLRSRLRRPLLSPLSYGGCATPKGTSRTPRRVRVVSQPLRAGAGRSNRLKRPVLGPHLDNVSRCTSTRRKTLPSRE